MGSTLGYRPALDGLRAVAITAVVGVHAFGVPAGGALGVDLFFVLSGFLITTLLLEEHGRAGRLSLGAFYRRRARRLLPALLVFVAAYLLISLLVLDSTREDASLHVAGALSGVAYVSNVVQASGGDLPNGIIHLWSLSAEEQFYVLWPAVLLVALGVFRASRRALLAALILAVLLIQLTSVALLAGGASSLRLVYGPDVRAGSILVGCLLAVVCMGRSRPRVGPLPLALALAVVVGSLALGFGRGGFAGPMLLFACAAAVLVLAALDPTTWLARVLSVGPLVYLGKISYSLYLWHLPILVWVGVDDVGFELAAVGGIAVALAASVASYHFVERPFRYRRPERRSRPAVLQPAGRVVHSPSTPLLVRLDAQA